MASSVRSPRTISSSGSTATGLKKWKPTTRSGCSSSAAIAVTDSERGVGGQHALRRDDLLQLGPDLLLDAEVLEDRLDDEVGVGEDGLVDRAGDQAAQLGGRALVQPALGDEPCRSRRARSRRPCRPGPGPGRSARPAPRGGGRTAAPSWQAIRPAPTMPTLVTVAGQALVRRAGRPLGPPLHQVEGVQAAAQLVGDDQVGQRLVLGGGAGRRTSASLASRQQVQRPVRGRDRAVQPLVERSAGRSTSTPVPHVLVDLGPGRR